MLRSFPQDDRDHMVENGMITVTCEFCSSSYVFEPAEISDQESRQAITYGLLTLRRGIRLQLRCLS